VDRLVPPKLPRLRPTGPPLHLLLFPEASPDLKLSDSLAAAGLSLYVLDIVTTMSLLSKSLQHAADQAVTIPARSFDEDSMGIQYDLLMIPAEGVTALDFACRSAALLYMKSLTRIDPCNFTPVVGNLVESVGKISLASSNARLLLWINFIGAMYAQESSKRYWFRHKLVFLREFLNLEQWSDAEAILCDISWIRQLHSVPGEKVWGMLEETNTLSITSQSTSQPLTPTSISSI
jgi:hypothetical protein